MDTDAFWDVVEQCRRAADTLEERLVRLEEELSRRPLADVVRFQVRLEEVVDDAYTWELWAAADRIKGGWCSDDGFFYFRLWLVGCGRAAFERVLGDPDSLAELPEVRRLAGRPRAEWCDTEEWPDWEELDYVAESAFARLTGGDGAEADERDEEEVSDEFLDAVAAEQSRPIAPDAPPRGVRWEVRDEAEAARRLPVLSALFPLDSRFTQDD
ncbi:DUF4240 domain-containing protein [Kitasatospora sp. NPDC090091]|uniref:DUF4240 domain-containing protein n=1 Tax=Kitasatospora sp. NPDC090091 TaxID=3364081 RepID=UPI0037F3124C